MLKKVLIIAPQFSPSSYPPAQRIRFFTNHLEEFGWKPIVLTVESQFLEEDLDWEFAKLTSETLEVVRTKALPAKWTRKLGIGDLGIRSFWHQLKAAEKICKNQKIDLLFIPGPPWHTFLIGPIIKKALKIPYVLDYIDPWVMSLGENDPPWTKAYWFRKMAMWLEPFAIRDASRIVAVSEGTNEGIRNRHLFLQKEKFTSIPYGAEMSDFEFVRKRPAENKFFQKGDANFNFVYVGAMLPKAYGTLRALFAAVKELKSTRYDLYRKMRFHFIGTTYAANPTQALVVPTAEEIGVGDVVSEHPKRVPYTQANTLLTQADAILTLGSSEAHYTASKIYPAILADRPLLAIYHESSSVVAVMNETGVGELITYTSQEPAETKVREICEAIERIMDPFYTKPHANQQALERYSARNMTKKLASVFDGALNSTDG